MKPTYGRISLRFDCLGVKLRPKSDHLHVPFKITPQYCWFQVMITKIQQVCQEVPAYHKGLTGISMAQVLPKEYLQKVWTPVHSCIKKRLIITANGSYRWRGELASPQIWNSSVLYHRFILYLSNLQRFDGTCYGQRSTEAETLEDWYVKSRSDGSKWSKRRIIFGTFSF